MPLCRPARYYNKWSFTFDLKVTRPLAKIGLVQFGDVDHDIKGLAWQHRSAKRRPHSSLCPTVPYIYPRPFVFVTE